MKICLLSRFFDLRNAGIGRYSLELRNALRSMGHQVATVSQDGGIPVPGESRKYFVYTAFEIAFKIPRGCDIYHACSPLEALHAPRPLTVFFHDLIPMFRLKETETGGLLRGFRRWFGSLYFRKVGRVAVAKAEALMSPSEQTKEELIRELGAENKITVVRHGIRPDLEPRQKKDDTFRVGSLSYLDPRKRIDLLIRAFLEADVEGELWIAGKGIDYPRLKALARGDPRIKFLGFVPDEELVDFYNSLDVFIFPTKIEGYGFPMVEAMACKKPVVTLSDAIIPKDIKDRTIVVDDLTRWLKDPDFSGIDLNDNYRFAKLHDWERCAEEHVKIFEEVLSGSRR